MLWITPLEGVTAHIGFPSAIHGLHTTHTNVVFDRFRQCQTVIPVIHRGYYYYLSYLAISINQPSGASQPTDVPESVDTYERGSR